MSRKNNRLENDKAIEAALAKIQALEPSPDLANRIMADAVETLGPKPPFIFWPFGKIWQPVFVMVAATLLGVWVGINTTSLDKADLMTEIETMMMG